MTRTRIKICGIRDLPTALTAAAAGADAIGLVFVGQSPRVIDIDSAAKLVRALPAMVEPVGLFVDEPVDHIREIVSAVGLRTVQLHGDEKPDDLAALSNLRVIKAIGFDPATAEDQADRWLSARVQPAAILWDTPALNSEALPGGSGLTFNWQALARFLDDNRFDHLPPAILAGGLNWENVGEAVAVVHPYAVDVSSGVESSRGVKDAAQIARFCRAVRRADQP